jgi:nucleoside-diphosphate-sugar epimerase
MSILKTDLQEPQSNPSIVIPTYNSAKTLRICLESIKNQEYSGNMEIIIADGGSTDSTQKTLKNNELIVYGGEQILDFVYINAVVEAFIKTLGVDRNIFVNVGSENGINVIDLAQIIKKITRSESKVIIKEKRTGEVEKFIANIEKAEKILNWKPRTILEEGIRLLIQDNINS